MFQIYQFTYENSSFNEIFNAETSSIQFPSFSSSQLLRIRHWNSVDLNKKGGRRGVPVRPLSSASGLNLFLTGQPSSIN